MLSPYILKLQLSNILIYLKKTTTINVNNILDILGISVFGYNIYMYKKQDLFSNDIDNAGFRHESVMCIQSMFIV